MKKKVLSLLLFMLFAHLTFSQEVNTTKKVEENLVEIKSKIKLDEASYDYIKQLLVYYYNNYNSDSKTKSQVKENIHNKLKAKLSDSEYKILNDNWLNNNLK